MPQDTIIEVLRTEEKMNQIREQTAADCRQKLLMAQRSADRLREQARADAEAEVREMMSEAERPAARPRDEGLPRASAGASHGGRHALRAGGGLRAMGT